MADVTVKRLDEFEAVYHGGMRRVRAGLGVTSFGMQVIELPPNADMYPEHDHAHDEQEEVYTVLHGQTTLRVGDDEYDLVPGVFVRIGPQERRKFVTGDEGARILALGATPGTHLRDPGFHRRGRDPRTFAQALALVRVGEVSLRRRECCDEEPDSESPLRACCVASLALAPSAMAKGTVYSTGNSNELQAKAIAADGSLEAATVTPTGAVTPRGIAITPDARHLYMTTAGANVLGFSIGGATVAQVPGSPYNVTDTGGYGLAISPGGQFLYTLNQNGGAGSVSIFAIQNGDGALTKVGTNVPLGYQGDGIAISPTTRASTSPTPPTARSTRTRSQPTARSPRPERRRPRAPIRRASRSGRLGRTSTRRRRAV